MFVSVFLCESFALLLSTSLFRSRFALRDQGQQPIKSAHQQNFFTERKFFV